MEDMDISAEGFTTPPSSSKRLRTDTQEAPNTIHNPVEIEDGPRSQGSSSSEVFYDSIQSPDHTMRSLMENSKYSQHSWGKLLEPTGKKSPWWSLFWVHENPQNDPVAKFWPKCKGCMTNYSIGTSTDNQSTTPMKLHAIKCDMIKKNPTLKKKMGEILISCGLPMIAESKSDKIVGNKGSSNSKNPGQKSMETYGFNRSEEIKLRAMEFLIMEFLPLDIIQSPSFRRLLHACNHSSPVMGKDMVKTAILAADLQRIAVFREMLQDNPFAITHDSWTSCQQIGYLAVTVHFVDKHWKLKSLPLACTAAANDEEGSEQGSHSADTIVKLVIEVLNTYGLSLRNCSGFATDTAATMQKAARQLKQHGTDEGGFLIFNPCAAHTLELTAKLAGDRDKNDANLESAITKAKRLVSIFRKSPKLTLALSEAKSTVPQLKDKKFDKLIQDVKTRWWATWSLIDRLVDMKPALDILLLQEQIEDEDYLTDSQWTILKMVKHVLEPFKVFQKLLEGESYITTSLTAFCVCQIRISLKKACNNAGLSEGVRDMSRLLLEDFNNRWGSGVDGTVYDEHSSQTRMREKGLSLAAMWGSILDPRTMLYTDIYGPIDRGLIIQGAKDEATRLYSLLHNLDQNGNGQAEGNGVRSIPSQQGKTKSYFDLDLLGIQEVATKPQIISENELENSVNHEYCALLREDPLPLPAEGVDADPIRWWYERQHQFPILFCLAKRILIIPATSAPSERLFSNAGITIANDRANLLPENAESLVLLHDYLKYKYGEDKKVRAA